MLSAVSIVNWGISKDERAPAPNVFGEKER